MDADWPVREAQLKRAQEAVAELRSRLLDEEGISPMLLAHAFIGEGLGETVVKLDDEQKLIVFDTLEEYMGVVKRVMAEWKN